MRDDRGLDRADLDRHLTTEPALTYTHDANGYMAIDPRSHLILIAHGLRVIAAEMEREVNIRDLTAGGVARVSALRDYARELEGMR